MKTIPVYKTIKHKIVHLSWEKDINTEFITTMKWNDGFNYSLYWSIIK